LPFIPPLGAAGESAAFAPASARANHRSSFSAIPRHATSPNKKFLSQVPKLAKGKKKFRTFKTVTSLARLVSFMASARPSLRICTHTDDSFPACIKP
jgi:hypothetical protein